MWETQVPVPTLSDLEQGLEPRFPVSQVSALTPGLLSIRGPPSFPLLLPGFFARKDWSGLGLNSKKGFTVVVTS